jgi:Icc protein
MVHPTPPSPPAPLRVLQITDTHLFQGPSGRLLGLDTQHSLDLVLGQACSRHWPADLVLATGDLVHDASTAGYERLRHQLGALGPPVYCVSGNHDESAQVTRLMDQGGVRTVPCAAHGGWAFALVDSTRPGDDGGHLSATALALLAECLERHRQRHLLVCLHHQPVPMDSPWLDTMMVDNAAELFRLIDAHPQVRGVLWGHVHQAYDGERRGVRLLACPSTCIQFLPRSQAFSLDPAPPGYRWLELHRDGRIDTGVERLAAYPEGLDLTARGY